MVYRPASSTSEPNKTQLNLEQRKIIDIINNSSLNRTFINKLSENVTSEGLNLDQPSPSSTSPGQSGSIAPSLTAAKNPYNPFASGTSSGGQNDE
jgi:hypothetical protein